MRSVFQFSRWTCQVPRAKAVIGIAARRSRPGPCFFRPARTRVGGWSIIETKFGLSAGLWALRRKGKGEGKGGFENRRGRGVCVWERGNWRRRGRIVRWFCESCVRVVVEGGGCGGYIAGYRLPASCCSIGNYPSKALTHM